MMISKRDYIWLERHTKINNYCQSVDDLAKKDLALKIYRPSHLKKLQSIFSENKQELYLDADDLLYVKIKGFTLDDFNNVAQQNNGDLIYNQGNGQIYYLASDKKKYKKILRRSSPKMLANLSTRKKLDILLSLDTEIYISEEQRQKNKNFLSQNSNKLLALLQMKLPKEFVLSEIKKVHQIVSQIRKIPHIKEDINNFSTLPFEKQECLLKKVSKITADVNNIPAPEIYFLSNKEIVDEFGSSDWKTKTDAYTYDTTVCINKDKIKNYDGTTALTIPFHETNHVAQSRSDYSEYPEVEEMFCHKLDFLDIIPETYIFMPQELITYELERHFTEEIISQIQTHYKYDTYSSEHNIAAQYVNKFIRKSY